VSAGLTRQKKTNPNKTTLIFITYTYKKAKQLAF